jgi:hypothetical protein
MAARPLSNSLFTVNMDGWPRSLPGNATGPPVACWLGALVGVDLLDPLGLLPEVQELAAVVEVAGMVAVVVHGGVDQPDQSTVAAGVAGQVQGLMVALAQVSKQPGDPGGRVGGAVMGPHRWGPSAGLAGAPTCWGAGSTAGVNRRWATAVGTTAVTTTTLTSTENWARSMIPALSP